MKGPAANDFSVGSPLMLFDGRHVEVFAAPEHDATIGQWCKVREVLNARDPAFSCPDYGPIEKVRLAGAINAISKEGFAARQRSEVPS